MGGKSESDLLPIPKIPKPKKEDPEDVAWALSTAEAMWNRAENADAIKWIRRAAEAASEAEQDDRALELAKAAADLASLLVKVEGNPSELPPPLAEPAPNTLQSRAPVPPSQVPRAGASSLPPGMAGKIPSAPPVPKISPAASSRPAAPVVASRVPGPAARASSAAPPAPTPARVSGKPPAPPRAAAPQAALPKVLPQQRGDRRGRRSQPAGLSEDAKRAAQADVIARAGGEQEVTKPISAAPKRAAIANEARRRRSRPSPDEVVPPPAPSSTAQLSPVTPEQSAERPPSRADEIDEWPTQAIKHEDMPDYDDETRVGASAYVEGGRRVLEPASQDLRASQAVRVVVWRTPDGVHVAPAGTTVAAITVDALLVALDPNADLAAWLKG